MAASSSSSPGFGSTRSISASWKATNSARDALSRWLARTPVPFCGELLPRGERFSDLEPLRFEPRVGVEHIEVRGRVEQHLVLVLPVEVDERAGEVAQRGARREGAVDERAASSLRRHFPAHDDLATVGSVEDGLDRSGFLAGAHELGRGAAAHEQADGADEDGLAGPRLAS